MVMVMVMVMVIMTSKRVGTFGPYILHEMTQPLYDPVVIAAGTVVVASAMPLLLFVMTINTAPAGRNERFSLSGPFGVNTVIQRTNTPQLHCARMKIRTDASEQKSYVAVLSHRI